MPLSLWLMTLKMRGTFFQTASQSMNAEGWLFTIDDTSKMSFSTTLRERGMVPTQGGREFSGA